MAMYESVDEARLRLCRSILLYDGNPVWVSEVSKHGRKFLLQCGKLPTLEPMDGQVDLDDEKLNLRELPLGYVNLGDKAYYWSRMPIRKYQQGITSENTTILNLDVAEGDRPPGFTALLTRPEFSSMFKGVYPTFQQACQRLQARDGGPKSVAFNRRFAVRLDKFRGDYLLEYKGRKIGYGNAERFVLPEDQQYLREVVIQSGVRVA